jgi:hypothetical protein
MSTKDRIVAIEEHFWIPGLRDRYTGPRGISARTQARQLVISEPRRSFLRITPPRCEVSTAVSTK